MDDRDEIAFAKTTAVYDGAVQCQRPLILSNDLFKNGYVLCKRVGVKGGHHTAPSKLSCMNAYLAQLKIGVWPLSLKSSSNAADDDVRTESAAIHLECSDAPIRSDQERQDIKSLLIGPEINKHNLFTRSGARKLLGGATLPGVAIDRDLAVLHFAL